MEITHEITQRETYLIGPLLHIAIKIHGNLDCNEAISLNTVFGEVDCSSSTELFYANIVDCSFLNLYDDEERV